MESATHLVRRSRLRSFAAAAGHALHVENFDARAIAERFAAAAGIGASPEEQGLEKRITPADLASIQAQESASLASLASAAGAAVAGKTSIATGETTSTKAVAAQAATKGTTISTETLTSVVLPPISSTSSTFHSTVVTTSWENAPTSSSAVTFSSISSSVSSSASSSVSSSPSRSTSSAAPSSSLTSTSHTSTGVLTITASPSSSSASASVSLSALQAVTTSKNVSTGGIVGIVLAVIAGLFFIACGAAWVYRKYASNGSSWTKMDEDVTPFVGKEKDWSNPHNPNDDFYGDVTEAAPVIGSRRALALARQNAFNSDGSLRTDSVMLEREGNRAGLGAGMNNELSFPSYGSFPSVPQPAVYGVDAQGRPYNPEAGRVPMAHTIDAQYTPTSPPMGSRQLLGPNHQQHPFVAADLVPMPQPVPMGRPAAPDSYDDIKAHEDFGDLPENTRSAFNPVPKLMVPYDETEPYTPRTAVSTSEWAGDARPAMATTLPKFDPISPLMPTFTVSPPPSGQGPSSQTSTSIPLRLPQQPMVPQPYIHGQPLSPLTEVSTPLSSGSNPFDCSTNHMAIARQGGLAPPYLASVGSHVPSPRFPPPSPGETSVPGSVMDSPNWHPQRGRPDSMSFSDEDAYGGI